MTSFLRARAVLTTLLLILHADSVGSFAPATPGRMTITSKQLPLSSTTADNGDNNDSKAQMLSLLANPSETAVLFCKYQNDFCTPGGKIYDTTAEVMEATGMKQNSINLMTFCRNAGCQIVHCPLSLEPGQSQLTDMPYGVIPRLAQAGALTYGEWGSQLIDEMAPVEGDWIVPKYGLCAFSSTQLDSELRNRGIRNVIVVGFLTNGSVESTIRSAYERCYNVYTLPECCAACTLQEHVFSVNQNFPLYATVTDGMNVMQIMSTSNQQQQQQAAAAQ
mmetsp:Transcript_18458/g.50380  ORF Transcript_18458/g.50380 Transcript_18458/m.50380 type:complete len:277 (-) Transcript_18458:351-1181(-)|eukprot:CAMPEP_0168752986 /NCGR_PEP_ID=MMETSP0724-20121128/18690_1 /TAXON_ID=265536 /ORGANISM="Amphiprora sp., Strain CCMP467" /LENGTH=276 /DNA_ID=CAMNT_0008801295 /DNA_START=36 /DNA_END=866 /DNA_ORIENTATION=+